MFILSIKFLSQFFCKYVCLSPFDHPLGGLFFFFWTQEHFLRRISIWFSTQHSSLKITSRSSEKYIFISSTTMLYYKIHNLMFITQNNDPLITLSHISRPSLDLYHCWCWTMKSFHKFAFNGFLKVNLGVWTSQLHPTFFTFQGEKFFSKKRQHEFALSHFWAATQ